MAPLKSVFYFFPVMEKTYADSWSDMWHELVGHEVKVSMTYILRSSDLPYILKTIWYMNIIVRDNGLVWHDIWPQNKCRSLWPIFHDPVILPYTLKTIWCMTIIIWDNESVWPEIWPQNKYRSLWPIFRTLWPIVHGPVICLISWRLFGVLTQ